MVGATRCPDRKHKKKELRYMCGNRRNQAGCAAKIVKADYLHKGLDELVRLFVGDPENINVIAQQTVEILKNCQKEKLDILSAVRGQLEKVTRQKSNLIGNLKEAPDLGRIIKDDLIALSREQDRLQEILLQTEKERCEISASQLEARVRAVCNSIFEIWDQAPIKQKNQILKGLIRRAEVNTQTKEVLYILPLPVEMSKDPDPHSAWNKGHVLKSPVRRSINMVGGCTEVLAEVRQTPYAPTLEIRFIPMKTTA